MSVNNKLTHAIKDRVVQNLKLNRSELLISFVDGSTMKVKIAESNSPPLREGTRIRQISEDQAKLLLECEDDSIFDLTIVDPGNSVIVRDKNGSISDNLLVVFLTIDSLMFFNAAKISTTASPPTARRPNLARRRQRDYSRW